MSLRPRNGFSVAAATFSQKGAMAIISTGTIGPALRQIAAVAPLTSCYLGDFSKLNTIRHAKCVGLHGKNGIDIAEDPQSTRSANESGKGMRSEGASPGDARNEAPNIPQSSAATNTAHTGCCIRRPGAGLQTSSGRGPENDTSIEAARAAFEQRELRFFQWLFDCSDGQARTCLGPETVRADRYELNGVLGPAGCAVSSTSDSKPSQPQPSEGLSCFISPSCKVLRRGPVCCWKRRPGAQLENVWFKRRDQMEAFLKRRCHQKGEQCACKKRGCLACLHLRGGAGDTNADPDTLEIEMQPMPSRELHRDEGQIQGQAQTQVQDQNVSARFRYQNPPPIRTACPPDQTGQGQGVLPTGANQPAGYVSGGNNRSPDSQQTAVDTIDQEQAGIARASPTQRTLAEADEAAGIEPAHRSRCFEICNPCLLALDLCSLAAKCLKKTCCCVRPRGSASDNEWILRKDKIKRIFKGQLAPRSAAEKAAIITAKSAGVTPAPTVSSASSTSRGVFPTGSRQSHPASLSSVIVQQPSQETTPQLSGQDARRSLVPQIYTESSSSSRLDPWAGPTDTTQPAIAFQSSDQYKPLMPSPLTNEIIHDVPAPSNSSRSRRPSEATGYDGGSERQDGIESADDNGAEFSNTEGSHSARVPISSRFHEGAEREGNDSSADEMSLSPLQRVSSRFIEVVDHDDNEGHVGYSQESPTVLQSGSDQGQAQEPAQTAPVDEDFIAVPATSPPPTPRPRFAQLARLVPVELAQPGDFFPPLPGANSVPSLADGLTLEKSEPGTPPEAAE